MWLRATTAHSWSGPTRVGASEQTATEFVVYDTSLRREVARGAGVEYIGKNEVWFTPESGSDRYVYRFDVPSGSTTRLLRSDMDAVLDAEPRIFAAVTGDGRVVYGQPSFTVLRGRLVASIHYSSDDDDAGPVTLADGTKLQLRLPAGYVATWPADEVPTLSVSQWLDDDHVVLWADDGLGDLPAQTGDFLVCRLPNGVCRVTVPRSSQTYVAPYLN